MKLSGFAVGLLIGIPAFAQLRAAAADTDGRARQVLQVFGQSPLTLEENRGQAPPGVDFIALGLGHKFLLSPTGATLKMFDARSKRSHSVQVQLVGANPSARSVGLDRVPFTNSYFSAGDPKGTLRNLPHYAKVRYRSVWPGIDVAYYGNREQLEYDMIVAPEAHPDAIRLKLTGESRFSLNHSGDLELETPYGTVTHHKPIAFQMIDRRRREVAANFALVNRNEVRIQLGAYDRSRELVIDPTLALSSPTITAPVSAVLAGVDGSGNIYTAVSDGQGSVFILSFDSAGNPRNQGTFFADTVGGMVVTPAGKVYLTGATSSTNYPAQTGAQTQLADPNGVAKDAFFLEYSAIPNPVLLYSTFFGGIGDDVANAIALDTSGNAYITGQTVGGTGFVHTVGPAFGGGGTDAFVAKFNPSFSGAASLIYSSFIGGNGADSGNGIGVDGNGAAYIGGATTSTSATFQPSSATGFNTSKSTASNDGFLVKLNAAGTAATYLTFLPSAPVNALAQSNFVAYVTGAVDGTTNVLSTTPSGFQLTNGGNGCATFGGTQCTDAFLSAFNTTMNGPSSLTYSTYLGGSLNDAGTGVAVDNSGNAWVVGRTNSSNFPTARPLAGLGSYQGAPIVGPPTPNVNTQFDAFLAKIETTNSGLPSLVYSTYLGGNDTDQANNVAVDANGNAFIGGLSSSTNFPNTTASPSATGAHGFFAKVTDSAVFATLNITKTHTGSFFQGQTNATYTITVSNVGGAATSGTVTVTDTVPGGLVFVSMSGTGWSCVSTSCTRSDALGAATSYAPITVTVNVNGNATSPQVNMASVSGGGATGASVNDSTTILTAPSLSITKTHSGNFTQGQLGGVYTVIVSNAAGATSTSGTVTVTDALPGGLSFGAGAMSGSGWSCAAPTCTRSDALAGGSSYPPITVSVNVAGNATTPQTNQVTVSGGGSLAAMANDSTTVLAASQPSLSITKTHAGNFSQGQQNAVYTVTVSNNHNAAATSGTVTVTDTLPSGITLVSMSGTGWSCASVNCTRSDVLAGGTSYPAITVTVNVSGNATSPQVNQVTVSGGGSASAMASDSTTISINTPTLSVNRSRLNFGYSGGLITSPQTVTVNITGGLNVGWTVSSNRSNVTVSPASGTGSGTFQVTAAPPSGGGSSGAVVTVTSPGATGSPQQVLVNVNSVTPTLPYGSFDTPANNTVGIAGSVPVTGWSLDPIEVTDVSIWREPNPGEAPSPNGLAFIGHANFVADARTDVAVTFPNAPFQYRGGWGYLMLSNFLPNSSGSGPIGNGTYNLHAIATNKAGATFDLGTRTITVDNIHATKPFGAIDTPDQGGTASGSSFVNFGWALTQNPFFIPVDGSTINVFLDGAPIGHPTYNQFRSDVATLFPGLANSNGAVGFFFMDTTKLQNRVHTLSWSVADNAGRIDGIGSRFFAVLNANGGGVAAPEDPPTPESLSGAVRLRSGYDLNASAAIIDPDSAGAYSIEMEQLGRIELSLGATKGYLDVGGEAQALPLGSSLKAGVFYWQAPLGFLGKYDLLFEQPDGRQIPVHINITPKAGAAQ